MIARRRAHLYPNEFAEIGKLLRKKPESDAKILSAWECAVAGYLRMPRAAATGSGRAGMLFILKHLGIGKGDEVIIPAYTLKDLVSTISNTGARVVPADIDEETLNISLESVIQKTSPRTKAIIALHAFGSPCPIEDIVSFGNGHGIPVIEDCAHALGSCIGDSKAGSVGYASFFSFEAMKPVNTFGGGMVISRDDELIDWIHENAAGYMPDIRILRKKINAVRAETMLFSTGIGYPFLCLLSNKELKAFAGRLYRRFQTVPPVELGYSSVQASLGLKKIQTLEVRLAAREEKARFLSSLLKREIIPQGVRRHCRSSRYFYIAILPCEAARIRQRLLLSWIDAGIEDEIADDCASMLGYDDCPTAKSVYTRAIALPFYDAISEKDLKRVAGTINGVVS